MRVKSPRLEQLLIETLSQAGPLGAKEFYRKVCSRLKKGESLSEPTFFRYLKDLQRKGVFEKTADGKWRLNERGLFRLHRITALNTVLHECQLVESALAEVYFRFTQDFGGAVDYYIAGKFSGLMEDAAEEVIRRFYREATIAFLMSQPEEDNILEFYDKLVQGLGQATITSLMTQRAKQYFEFYDKLLQEFGLAIWLGIKSMFGISKRNENLWQTIDRLSRDAEGLDWLSTYLLHGLEQIFADDETARAFLKVLHYVGALGELVFLLINQDKQRAEQILSNITGPPREGEVDLPRLKSFIKWLMGLKAVGFITISADHFASLMARIAMNDFESWFKDLKNGILDHRIWIFGRSPDAPPGLKSGREVLLTLIRHPEWLQPQDGLDPRREEIFSEKLDIQEVWTLGDIVAYHPRGKDIEFYKEILREIERRLEVNPELRQKLKQNGE
jgi:hypothetical protein